MPGQILQLHSATDTRPDPVHRDTARGRNQPGPDARPFADQLNQVRQSSERGKALPRGRQDTVPAGRQPEAARERASDVRPRAVTDQRPAARAAQTDRPAQPIQSQNRSVVQPDGRDPQKAAPPVDNFKARLAESSLNKADQAKALSQFRQLAADLEAMMEQAASSTEGLSSEWLDDIAERMAQLADLLDTQGTLDDDVDFSALIEAALNGGDTDFSLDAEDAESDDTAMAAWALNKTGSLEDLDLDTDQDWFVMTGDGEWASLDELEAAFREDQGEDEPMTLMAFSDWLAGEMDEDVLSGAVSDDMAELLSQADMDPETPVILLAAGDSVPEGTDTDWADWLMALPVDGDDAEAFASFDELMGSSQFAALFQPGDPASPGTSAWLAMTMADSESRVAPAPMLDPRFVQDEDGPVMPAALVGLKGDGGNGDSDSEDPDVELELGREESKNRREARQALSEALLSRLQADAGRSGSQEDSGTLRQPFESSLRENQRSTQDLARQHVERELPVKNSAGELTQQLGERLVIMIGQDIQEARIRLDPPDMGGMDIRVTTQNDQVQVQVVAQQPMVRDLLEQHAQRLREMLEQQGFTDVDVDVSDQPWQDESTGDDADDSDGNRGDGADEEGDDLPRASAQPLGLVDHYV